MGMLPTAVRRHGYVTVLVIGGEHFDDAYTLYDLLDRLLAEADNSDLKMTVLQCGGATGTASLARTWGRLNEGVAIVTENRASGGPSRNQLTLDEHQPDICVVTTPAGPWTEDMVQRCEQAKVPVLPATGTVTA